MTGPAGVPTVNSRMLDVKHDAAFHSFYTEAVFHRRCVLKLFPSFSPLLFVSPLSLRVPFLAQSIVPFSRFLF